MCERVTNRKCYLIEGGFNWSFNQQLWDRQIFRVFYHSSSPWLKTAAAEAVSVIREIPRRAAASPSTSIRLSNGLIYDSGSTVTGISRANPDRAALLLMRWALRCYYRLPRYPSWDGPRAAGRVSAYQDHNYRNCNFKFCTWRCGPLLWFVGCWVLAVDEPRLLLLELLWAEVAQGGRLLRCVTGLWNRKRTSA